MDPARLASPNLLVIAVVCACNSEPAGRRAAQPPEPDQPTGEDRPSRGEPEGLALHLPRPEVGGFRMSADGPRSFAAQNLHEYMDGQADSYLEYGFVGLAVADYRSGSRTVQIEVYDMGTKPGAFGRWSRLAVEGGDPAGLVERFVGIGGGGVASGTELAFWKDRYLVKLTFLDESPQATEESMRSAGRAVLEQIARAMASTMAGDVAPLEELARLPAGGLVAHSQVRYGRALLDVDALGPGIAAEYAAQGKRMRLHFAERTTAAEATAAYDALTRPLAGAAPITGLGDAAIRGTHPDRGEMVAARKGSLVVAVTNSETPDALAAEPDAKMALVRTFLGE